MFDFVVGSSVAGSELLLLCGRGFSDSLINGWACVSRIKAASYALC